MLDIQNIPFIIYILFAMHIFFYGAAGAWLIYSHREQHDHSRLYIAITFLYLALGCIIFIATGLGRGDLNGFIDTILEPYPLIISFLPVLTFPLYVVEIMHPKWMNWKRMLMLISPWIAICAAWLIYHGVHGWHYNAITHLSHVREIVPNIHQTDVLLRVLLAAIYFPYAFATLFVRYNWRTTNVKAKKLWLLKGLIVLVFFGFIIGMVLRIHSIMLAYFVVLDVISFYIVVLEQTARIPVPEIKQLELSPLAKLIQQQMDLGIWQDPDLDRDDLCDLLGTNRTYLPIAIRELGYANFNDMINRRRLQYVHDELLENPKATISDILFLAGYRNLSTPLRCFTQIYGCSPSDLVKNFQRTHRDGSIVDGSLTVR